MIWSSAKKRKQNDRRERKEGDRNCRRLFARMLVAADADDDLQKQAAIGEGAGQPGLAY
jgi:hypothetical protein